MRGFFINTPTLNQFFIYTPPTFLGKQSLFFGKEIKKICSLWGFLIYVNLSGMSYTSLTISDLHFYGTPYTLVSKLFLNS